MIPRDAIDDSEEDNDKLRCAAKAVRFPMPGVKENAVRAMIVVDVIAMLAITNALE